MKLGYLYGGKLKGSVNLGIDPYTGLPSTFTAPGGFIGPTAAFGKFYYADAVNGNDANDGLSPATAKKTLTAAVALCVAGKGDIVVIVGEFNDPGNVTLNKEKMKLIGICDPWQQSYLSRINPGALATSATLLITAKDIEVAYMQVSGHRDPGFHYPAIYTNATPPLAGTRSYIHDIVIPSLTPDGTHYCDGIHLVGDRHTVVRTLIENSVDGIKIDEEGGVTTYRIVLEDIQMRACDVGVDVVAVSEATPGRHGVIGKRLDIDAFGALAETRGIRVQGGGGHPYFRDCYIAGYTIAITKGSARWINCYHEAAGGTKIDPAAY